MNFLHHCEVPLDLMGEGDTWTCDVCQQRWKKSRGRPVRVSVLRWLFGLD